MLFLPVQATPYLWLLEITWFSVNEATAYSNFFNSLSISAVFALFFISNRGNLVFLSLYWLNISENALVPFSTQLKLNSGLVVKIEYLQKALGIYFPRKQVCVFSRRAKPQEVQKFDSRVRCCLTSIK
jgi:hypothetical protein